MVVAVGLQLGESIRHLKNHLRLEVIEIGFSDLVRVGHFDGWETLDRPGVPYQDLWVVEERLDNKFMGK